MKVLYDHQIFMLQNFGGISRYFYELMNAYDTSRDTDFDLALKFSNNHYIEKARFSSHRHYYKKFDLHNRLYYKFYDFINSSNSKAALSRGDFDVFHPTYYDTYFLDKIHNKPFVITIHDMIHEIYKEEFREDKTAGYKKILAQKADKIIAVSENTKNDVIKYYGIDEEKIKVIYHGNSFKPDSLSKDIHIDLPQRYVLFVGVRRGYKNFETFAKALQPLMKNDDSLNLVCVGGGSFEESEKAMLKSLDIDRRTYQHSIDDNTLGEFYRNALAFVYPSLYEGFGIPILEAFTCGCPVVLSNSSCFPEVAGDNAVYFNPQDENSIKEVLEKVIYDGELRDSLKHKGFHRVKDFSWEKTAEQTELLYKSIL